MSCTHEKREEVRDGAGRVTALRCTTCLTWAAVGACAWADCGKLITLLTHVLDGRQFCSIDCHRKAISRKASAARAAKKAQRDRGDGPLTLPGVEMGGLDLLSRARKAR